jgi:hypothetical protein
MWLSHVLIMLQEPKGAFLSEWVLRTLATHLAAIDLSCYQVQKSDGLGFPKAALLLAVAAVSGPICLIHSSSDFVLGAACVRPDLEGGRPELRVQRGQDHAHDQSVLGLGSGPGHVRGGARSESRWTCVSASERCVWRRYWS